MQICIFTDHIGQQNFMPLSLTRPVDDLRIGILTIREKWLNWLQINHYSRLVVEYLSGEFPEGQIRINSDCLWINSRVLPNQELINRIEQLKNGDAIYIGETLAILKSDGTTSASHFNSNEVPKCSGNKVSGSGVVLTHFWDMLIHNGTEIEADLQFFNVKKLSETDTTQYFGSSPDNVFISEKATIEPNCTFIADEGPIFIGDHAVIEAGSVIRGPVAICDHAIVKSSARIGDGTTIGPVCKAGGEITNSIFHSYSNKSHDGFVGNSIIGQWCNFGANTITSNLKNDYHPVRLRNWKTKEYFEGGVQFFGTVMADHTKTAIHTKLNTGTVCGVSTNILSSKFTPAIIPSFTWLSDNGTMDYRIEKAISAMKAMMKRRSVEMNSEYESMIRSLYEQEKGSN
ncbi:MAG TPA: glucose-1-phosphate thymidylyltransferase [Balneolaceae bacterium]|nr:glucose-1-phosphate thymidylyltransferase [Balneolaceae bacterium]|tara:strand:- start:46124 stop:47326 length:1203 start_codon:yes stop_codon:yes gene_type:complete